MVTVSPDLLTGTAYQVGGGGIFFGVDTQNKTTWPTSGVRFLGSGELLIDFDTKAETQRYNIFASAATSVGPVGFNLRVQAESVEEDRGEPFQILSLGGFRRLSAFSEGSIPNDKYLLTTAEAFYRLTGTESIVNFPFYVGATMEHAEIDFDVFQDGRSESILAGAVYLGGETAIGPLYLGAGFGEQGSSSIFLHFGRAF